MRRGPLASPSPQLRMQTKAYATALSYRPEGLNICLQTSDIQARICGRRALEGGNTATCPMPPLTLLFTVQILAAPEAQAPISL